MFEYRKKEKGNVLIDVTSESRHSTATSNAGIVES
jgi:hypothetical protein